MSTRPVYAVRWADTALRDLRAVAERDRARIIAAGDALGADPRPPGCKRMKGQPRLWRIRVGDYRVLYEIADAVLLVVVGKVGHRREVYRRR